MKLEHSFPVPVPPEQAWGVLLDVQRIAPCMPGATIDTVGGDEFTGKVKVKVGPITLTYSGRARWLERDEGARRVVLQAKGKETRGAGTASATVTGTLREAPDGTRVDVLTDLAITGKPAQFGRGVMADVGAKLIGQFASCLADQLGAQEAAPPAPAEAEPASAPAPRSPSAPPRHSPRCCSSPRSSSYAGAAASARTPCGFVVSGVVLTPPETTKPLRARGFAAPGRAGRGAPAGQGAER
jgi:carbon monoxide dehydrogenase subunit G